MVLIEWREYGIRHRINSGVMKFRAGKDLATVAKYITYSEIQQTCILFVFNSFPFFLKYNFKVSRPFGDMSTDALDLNTEDSHM